MSTLPPCPAASRRRKASVLKAAPIASPRSSLLSPLRPKACKISRRSRCEASGSSMSRTYGSGIPANPIATPVAPPHVRLLPGNGSKSRQFPKIVFNRSHTVAGLNRPAQAFVKISISRNRIKTPSKILPDARVVQRPPEARRARVAARPYRQHPRRRIGHQADRARGFRRPTLSEVADAYFGAPAPCDLTMAGLANLGPEHEFAGAEKDIRRPRHKLSPGI
jgi:hypothetical protein